jgi:dynein light chain roadblock-type
MDHQNDLTFIRLRSHKDEILIAPDKEFTMIVVQKPAFN